MLLRNIKLTLVVAMFILVPFNVSAQGSAQNPIVIVPGIGGSFNYETMIHDIPTSHLFWDFSPGVNQYDGLISALRDLGLKKDEDFFVAFYDWRKPNSSSAENYLIPTIDRALQNSTTGKVDIVAHSMGGLVSRAYIQGDNYRDDVDKLVMLGTPNHGSSEVYVLWEGGMVPSDWDKTTQTVVNIYINLLKVLNFLPVDNYDIIHQEIQSIRELLPTYDYLFDIEADDFKFIENMQERNLFLAVLNLESNFSKLIDRVEVTNIVGNGTPTVIDIPVVDRNPGETKLWVDGKPDPLPPEPTDNFGDGAVPDFSAILPFFGLSLENNSIWDRIVSFLLPEVHAQFFPVPLPPYEEEILEAEHGALPTVAIPEIFNALGLPEPVQLPQVAADPEQVLSFWFASPVEVLITTPSGKKISRTINELPNSIYSGEEDIEGVKMVLIQNPANGTYTIDLTGLNNGEYHMGVFQLSDEGDNTQVEQKSISLNEEVQYKIAYNSNSPGTPADIEGPIISDPGPTSLELAYIMNESLEKYISKRKIRNQGAKRMLRSSLKDIIQWLKAVEEGRGFFSELRARLSLSVFIVRLDNLENRRKVPKFVADDLREQAGVILSGLTAFGEGDSREVMKNTDSRTPEARKTDQKGRAVGDVNQLRI